MTWENGSGLRAKKRFSVVDEGAAVAGRIVWMRRFRPAASELTRESLYV